jgi:hypothetical protein
VKLVRSVIVLSTAAAVALVPAAALADTKSHRDAAGDVRSVAYDPATHNTVDSPSTAEPAAKLGDITKVKVSHGSTSIKFVIRYRDLAKAGSEQIHEIGIASPNGVRYVFVDAGPGHWKGRTLMTKANFKKKVSCHISRHIDYGDNILTVKVPRSCLGHPKVVRVGIESFIAYGSKMFYDQAYRTGGEFTDLLQASPRIHR